MSDRLAILLGEDEGTPDGDLLSPSSLISQSHTVSADGLLSPSSLISQPLTDRPWPTLDPAALYGLAGEVVRTLEPHTEADPVAVLASLLTAAGAAIGSGPHARAGHIRHPARLHAIIIGQTSKARKGTSMAAARLPLDRADAGFMTERVMGGYGSGEALVDAVRDPDDEGNKGARDKRLLIMEPEYARVLRVGAREGSTLTTHLRDAWDGSRLQARSRSATAVATGAHVSLIGHITAEELRRYLTSSDVAGGTANRLLYVCAKRSKLLPEPTEPDPRDLDRLGRRLAAAFTAARQVGTLTLADDALPLWRDLYRTMADDDPGGLLGAVTARPEAQTLRLAVTFALLDEARYIGRDHLTAAWALWSCSRDSAAHIFGDAIGDEVADKLLGAIRGAGFDGLDGTGQSAALGRHASAAQLDTARQLLEERGLVATTTEATAGRSRIVTGTPDGLRKKRKKRRKVTADEPMVCEESERSERRSPTDANPTAHLRRGRHLLRLRRAHRTRARLPRSRPLCRRHTGSTAPLDMAASRP